MALPDQYDLTGDDAIYAGDTWDGIDYTFGRFVSDAEITDGSPAVVSTDAAWSAGDVGALVFAFELVTAEDGSQSLEPLDILPDGVTVLSFAGDTATLTAPATGSGTNVVVGIGAMDMTGYTYLAQIRRSEKSAILATVPFDPVDVTKGKFHLGPLTKVQTAAIDTGLPGNQTGVWDLQETAPDGTVDTWTVGVVETHTDVSRLP